MFRKYFWIFSAALRNPSLLKHYEALINTERLSYEKLVAVQLEALKRILNYAYQRSPYYHRKFEEVGFDPGVDFKEISDIIKAPIITKADLIRHNTDIHVPNFESKTFDAETSGSSGQVLKFKKDESWDSFNRASVLRGYSWYGVHPWEKNGYFWGYNISPQKQRKVRLLDWLQNRVRIFTYNKSNIRDFIKRLDGAVLLSGYSSMIYEISRIINAEKIDVSKLNLKLIKGTSEKIYDSYQREVRQAFGLKMVSEYGAAESGIIAFECPQGNMHINMEGVFVEDMDGEIIITNLIAKSFPIIRYKLGDYIKLRGVDYECPCGMKHPIIDEVLGRVGKKIYGKAHIYPSLTFYYIFKNLAINKGIELNYQAVQEEKGELIFYIEQEISSDVRVALETEIKKYFNQDIQYEIIDKFEIHTYQKKIVDFVSKVDL